MENGPFGPGMGIPPSHRCHPPLICNPGQGAESRIGGDSWPADRRLIMSEPNGPVNISEHWYVPGSMIDLSLVTFRPHGWKGDSSRSKKRHAMLKWIMGRNKFRLACFENAHARRSLRSW